MTTEAATVEQSHTEGPWRRAEAETDRVERYLGETVRHRP